MAANDEGDRPEGEATRLRARDLNELIRYTMWSVFKVTDRAALDGTGAVSAASSSAGLVSSVRRDVVADEVTGLLEEAAGKGTITRGCYDVQGLRADADYMFWWIAPSADDLQEMYARFRRTRLGRASEPVWSVMALHRPAEFNKGHIPAFLAAEEPKSYVCVYPFVRSYEWYLLEPAERRKMLAEHGVTVVSGLAKGIDMAAHEAARSSGGRTIAVLGTGITMCYPEQNRDLAEKITSGGALASQFWPSRPPRKDGFPRATS